MENSAYMPTSLASPALMVLASTAETRDALHLQSTPAFPGQTLDSKDMHIPFSASSFSMRPMYGQTDGFPSLPGHLLHLHSPFLTTSMERSLGFMNPGGAFRPVNPTTNEERNGFHSAFMPTSKGPKLEQNVSGFSHSLNNDVSYSSPPGRSSPLIVKEESSDKDTSSSLDLQERLTETPASDITEGTERSTPEEGRTLRRSKKRPHFDGQTPCCPVCGLSLRPGEIAAHFRLEELKLSKLSKVIKRSSKESPQSKVSAGSSSKKSKDSSSTSSGDKNSPESRWESYQRVKANRQSRLSARAKGKKRKQLDETTCPVCNERLTGTPEELNAHAEQCLRKREAEGDEDEPVDVEGETYEEYEWAGQTRIRATTLLQGGFSASGFQTSSSRNIEDQDLDLNVDGDDTETFGQPQFNEADIIPCSVDELSEDRERQALRGALVGVFPSKAHELGAWATQEGTFPGSNENEIPCSSYGGQNSDTRSMLDLAMVVESLKGRIKELEDQNAATNKFKCLICMGPFSMPLVSVSCWHVHCEECWLRTLGAKKLCPQCNMITSPQDLRRIYL